MLEELCQKLSIAVKYDRFFGKGGYCRLKQRAFFIINDSLSNTAKEDIFINELKQIDFDKNLAHPKLKEMINPAKDDPA
jgi:hypothetical protein